MKVGGGGRGDGHPDAVLGCRLEEPLDPGAGMLRALTLESVRQQENQAGSLIPLVLPRDDELVDDHLGAVHEVPELRLPHHEGVRDSRPSSRTRTRPRRIPRASNRRFAAGQRCRPDPGGRSIPLRSRSRRAQHADGRTFLAWSPLPPVEPNGLPAARLPNAIASATPQSTSPSSYIFRRDSTRRTNLGCRVNPSGGVEIARTITSRVSAGTPVGASTESDSSGPESAGPRRDLAGLGKRRVEKASELLE